MKALFLDRDGVINRYPGDTNYVTSLREFRFLPRAKKAIALLSKNKFKIFVISNQAGVGKGLYSQDTLDSITERMSKGVMGAGGKIERAYYCTHRQEENCSCRKPKTALIDKASKAYNIDLKRTFFIGDSIRDVITAKSAGCKSILVLSGREKLSNQPNWPVGPDFIFKDLWEAAKFILKQK